MQLRPDIVAIEDQDLLAFGNKPVASALGDGRFSRAGQASKPEERCPLHL